MEMDFVFWVRCVNIALAVFVTCMCFFKFLWNDPDVSRRARMAGLGTLSIVAASTAYDYLDQEFHFRVPLTTIGLIFAAFGLLHMSMEGQVRAKQK